MFNNRDLVVVIVTIALNEVPFTIFEIMLSKIKMSYRFVPSKRKYKFNTLYRHIFVYVLL